MKFTEEKLEKAFAGLICEKICQVFCAKNLTNRLGIYQCNGLCNGR